MTLPEYDEKIRGYAKELGLDIEIFHSNIEGEIVNKLYEANDRGFDAAIFNPAAFGSGYTAGAMPNPTYAEVCSGGTDHAEAVRIVFDPSVVSYETILHIFFTIHDPTTLNRQGNDMGTQYRSAIYYTSDEQKRVAEETVREITAERLYPDPVVTEIQPASEFYVAEDYHQEYFVNNQNAAYCAYVVAPKVKKFRDKYLIYMK